MRRTVYTRALKDVDHERAELLATIFRNCYFLGAGYNEDVVKESQKHWEPEWIKHYENVMQD
jgi:hypothetical protein